MRPLCVVKVEAPVIFARGDQPDVFLGELDAIERCILRFTIPRP